jgi:thioredoxin-dependent peroxiredoxin
VGIYHRDCGCDLDQRHRPRFRVLDSFQLTAEFKVATASQLEAWRGRVIIAGSVSDERAKKIYPQGWKALKPYIRIVPQPKA